MRAVPLMDAAGLLGACWLLRLHDTYAAARFESIYLRNIYGTYCIIYILCRPAARDLYYDLRVDAHSAYIRRVCVAIL